MYRRSHALMLNRVADVSSICRPSLWDDRPSWPKRLWKKRRFTISAPKKITGKRVKKELTLNSAPKKAIPNLEEDERTRDELELPFSLTFRAREGLTSSVSVLP